MPLKRKSGPTHVLPTTASSLQCTPSGNDIFATEIVEELAACQHRLKTLILPDGCAQALRQIDSALDELRERLNHAVEWGIRFPGASPLLSMQLCMAAGEEEPPEWSLGRLFLTSDALLFESLEQPPWTIGPFRWPNVCHLWQDVSTSTAGQPVDIYMMTETPEVVYRFSDVQKTDLLERFGHMCDGPPLAWTERHQRATGGCPRQPDETVTHELPPTSTHVTQDPPGYSTSELPPTSTRETQDPPAHSTRSALRDDNPPIPVETFVAKVDELPSLDQVPSKEKPCFSGLIKGVSVEKIATAMKKSGDENPHVQCIKNEGGADIQMTAWASGQRIPGTQICRIRYSKPLPEVPSTVKKLVKVPARSNVSYLMRLGRNADNFVMVQEVFVHDAPFGENFALREVTIWSDAGNNSTNMERYSQVRWVRDLPFGMGMIKKTIANQAIEGSKSSAVALVDELAKL